MEVTGELLFIVAVFTRYQIRNLEHSMKTSCNKNRVKRNVHNKSTPVIAVGSQKGPRDAIVTNFKVFGFRDS